MVEGPAIGGVGGEEEVVFLLVALDGEMGEAEKAAGAPELLDEGELGGVGLGVEGQAGRRSWFSLPGLDDVLAEGMGQPVEVAGVCCGSAGGVFADEVVGAPGGGGDRAVL